MFPAAKKNTTFLNYILNLNFYRPMTFSLDDKIKKIVSNVEH